jgi:hypothetical protein
MKKRTSVKIRNGAANHRGNDVLVLEGKDQVLQVRIYRYKIEHARFAKTFYPA